VAALVLDTPARYEASAGVFAGTAPAGTQAIAVYSGPHRLVARFVFRRPSRRFRVGPATLPPGDHTLRVLALGRGHTLAAVTVGPVYGLPPSAGLFRPIRRTDRAAQRQLARLTGAGVRAVWLRDLKTGATASYNAGASFTGASVLKLAILVTALARGGGDPVTSGAFPALRKMVVQSDNRAADEVLVRIGGSTSGGGAAVNALCSAIGCRNTDQFGGYIPDTRRRGDRRVARADVPPVTVEDEPSIPVYGKHTTAHDLGVVTSQLLAATHGRGLLARHGVSAREARVGLWLLLHASYPGLVRPATPYATAHKAGWLGDVQHDAAIVFAPRGPLIAIVMTQGGVTLASSQRYARRVVNVALRRLR
jgi:beta-lactamase class A